MYTSLDKLVQISQYAQFTYGSKVTLEQLRTSITMITRAINPKTINNFIEMATRDFSPLMQPQFRKEGDYYTPTPNKPKSPNELIGDAYKKQPEPT